AEIARERGKDGVDTLLDLTLEDDLRIGFAMQSYNSRIDRMTEILNDPCVLIALGDGGAHLDMLCDCGYPTFLLGTWVRERQIMPLERGVQRLTSEPADLFGIERRGRLAAGNYADVTIFDPAAIGSPSRPERRHDLPGGAKRMVSVPRGVETTIVNGAVTWSQGKLTGAAAGRVLRS
ncbi:MAG TPA: amidohydrolase family protein, partial [Stellaceae bacterium]|nr:amidohydrolase family protein [Stellaceae bacterium]